MPVHDRIELTRRMLECLRAQVVDEPVEVTVIDDGSTDGTAAYLRGQAGVGVLQGDGSLWWGGAIEAGLRQVLLACASGDWIMFVNNDTEIRADFIQTLVDSARRCKPAAVGSIIRDIASPHPVLSVGARIDAWRLVVRDRLEASSEADSLLPALDDHLHEVDALSGRGVLYPVDAFRSAGTMRARWLPHYFADYELSFRVRRQGYRLLVDDRATVFSPEDYGSRAIAATLRQRLFDVGSPAYLPAKAMFWWEASNWAQRLTLPLRALLFGAFPQLRSST